MEEEKLTVGTLTVLVGRVNGGDGRARNELLEHACERLRRLVRKQLRGWPLVHRWEQTDDVLQGVLMRLCRAMEQVQMKDVRHFFALSGVAIRRELIDLSRRFGGPEGMGRHHATQAPRDANTTATPPSDPADSTLDPGRLAQWTEFHELVDRLDDELKEVVTLLWYQGLTQVEAAELLGVAEKTVSRRWRQARLTLGAALEE